MKFGKFLEDTMESKMAVIEYLVIHDDLCIWRIGVPKMLENLDERSWMLVPNFDCWNGTV
jgi:hypothetical protein